MTDPKDVPEIPETPAPAGWSSPGDLEVPEPADGTTPAPASEGPGQPGDEAAALAAEVADWKDRHLRLAAEYDNYRKRAARERDELRTRAQGDLARRLLEALDDLGRVAHLDPAVTAAPDVIAGVELVERKVLRELAAAGLEAVSATGVPFDPEMHEAIATAAAGSPAEDHTVAAVFQPGYRFHGMLLRPARVQVRIFSEPSPAD